MYIKYKIQDKKKTNERILHRIHARTSERAHAFVYTTSFNTWCVRLCRCGVFSFASIVAVVLFFTHDYIVSEHDTSQEKGLLVHMWIEKKKIIKTNRIRAVRQPDIDYHKIITFDWRRGLSSRKEHVFLTTDSLQNWPILIIFFSQK